MSRAPAPAFSLVRIAVEGFGAFGVLKVHASPEDYQGRPFAVTLERTYTDQAAAGVAEAYVVSSTPGAGAVQYVKTSEGRRECRRRFYNRGGYWTFEILTPGHTAILFHKGNEEAHSEGCVLVGESFLVLGSGRPGIGGSGEGLAEFLKLAGARDTFALDVYSVLGSSDLARDPSEFDRIPD